MAVKKAVNSNSLVSLESVLKPLIDSNVIQLQSFDSSQLSAKKYRVTLANGNVETCEDLIDVIDECFDPYDALAWARDAFDSNPSDEDARRYLENKAEDFLSDHKCKVEEYFE